MVSMLRIVTFGEATISVDGERIAPSAHRMFALALHLAAERGRSIPRAILQAQLFGDCDERVGSHNLRQLVYRLRRLGAPILTTPSSLSVAHDEVGADYAELLEAEVLSSEQLDLVAKGFLPGYAPTVSDAYHEWVDGFRSRVTLALRRKALEAMAGAHERCDWSGVARAADACLALDPLNEDAILGHAEALAMSGSKAEALERIERYLSELPPAAEDCRAAARRLRQRIMRHVSEPAPLSLREMPLVGREEEMRRLTAALARTRSEGGGVVLISGEPGIGKTRLLTEFERLAALSGAQTARVVCRASTSHQPLSPFIELTRMLLQMPGALGCSPEALERLRTLCLIPPWRTHITADIAVDPREAFDEMAQALIDLIDSVSGESMLVVMLDDAHWLDASSLEAVRHVFEALHRAPVLLLVSSRNAFLADLPRDERTLELLELRRIPDRGIADLARRCMPVDTTPAMVEQIVRLSGGNPLLLHLLCSHSIRGREVGPTLAVVSDLYARRLELLPKEARGLLEYAVILGRNANLRRIGSYGLSTASLVTACRELDRLGLLHLEAETLCTAHPMVAEVALARIPHPVRKVLHHRAAVHLADEYAQTGEADLLWDCADHWEQSGDVNQAVAYLRRCAAHSLSVGQTQSASHTIQRALRMGPLPASVRQELLNEAVSICEVSGEWDEIGRLLDAVGVHDGRRFNAGSLSQPEIVGLDALRIVGTLGTVDPAPVFHVLNSRASHSAARLRAAVFLLSLADELFDRPLADAVHEVAATVPVVSPDESALMQKYELIRHTAFGDLGVACSRCFQMVDRLLTLGIKPQDVNTCFVVAYSLVRCGAIEDALQLLSSALGQLERWHMRHQALRCRCYLVWAALRAGNGAAAAESHGVALALANALPGAPPLLLHSNGVELAILDGRFSEALSETDRAAKRFPSLGKGKMRLELLQLRTRARVGSGMPPCSTVELEELLEGHVRGRSFGLQDDATEALVLALRHFGRASEAHQILTAYVQTHRRDPFPISEALTRWLAASPSPATARREPL